MSKTKATQAADLYATARENPYVGRLIEDEELLVAPGVTAIGALARYVSSAETKNYQPVNITFALLEPLERGLARSVKRKRDRHLLQVKLALQEWERWLVTHKLNREAAQTVAI